TQRARAIEVVKGALHRPVESQYSDVEHDLCVLRASQAEGDPVARLRDDRARVGEPVHAIGFIFGISPRFNTGEISALYDYDGGRVIQSTTPFSSGASGGGLFDDEGRVVGIVTFMSRAGAAYYFSLPVKWVKEALDRFREQPVVPLKGTPFWQRPRDEQPYFLRTAALEAENNWFGVVELARQWTRSEPENPTSWFILGKAHQRLQQNDQSIEAFRKAVTLDAAYSEAWYRLGLSYSKAGNAERIAQVHRVLQDLDTELARKLATATRECSEATITNC
ncbi:MAG TPA: trypsin-like peptidase domain-containing protein, partial [Burkholderiales bacterium]|nr:trypsin-like peptidase domain-containing protein [Burkholderiales bacterium]